jgi:membrane fusion protein (multidrug efflux system)
MILLPRLAAALLLGLAAAPAALSQTAAPSAAAAIPVGTVTVAARPVAGSLTATGRIEAIDRVDIVARIEGFLQEVAFTEGQTVAEGDLLYRIEPDSFAAAVRQAEGALEQSRAEKTLADIQLARAEELLAKAVGTAVARDQARAEAQRSAGSVASAEARLATARIELGYTEIRAPVAGRIGRTALTQGAVVNPAAGPLATIVSQDPMHVTFPISARQFLRRDAAGQPTDPGSIRVRLRFPDGSFYDAEGRIGFIDVSVDQATDTVIARSTLPNPDRRLIDGQLVTVVLESGTPVEKPVIPQQALIADQGGVYVFTVEDGKAAVRRVRPGGPMGPDVVIEEGLSVGDLVITEGVERIRAGVAVLAQPVAGTN